MHGCGSFPAETDGNPHPELLRRLAHFGPVGGRASISQICVPQPLRVPRTQGQFCQERTVHQQTNFVPGNSYRLSPNEGGGHTRYALAIQELVASFKLRVPRPLKAFQDAGPHGLICCCSMVCRRKVVSTDTSKLGWGSVCDGKPAFGLWSKKEGYLYINCLEKLVVCLGLHTFPPDLRGHHVLVHSDNMTVVSYINCQGGLFSGHLFILAERLLRWAQLNLCSLRATHVRGKLNLGADMLSRSNVPSDEWTLHPQTVQEIWGISADQRSNSSPQKTTLIAKLIFRRTWMRLPMTGPTSTFTLSPDYPDLAGNQANQGTEAMKNIVMLGAPLWRNQHWFVELVRLLTGPLPWPITLRRNLLGKSGDLAPPARTIGATFLASQWEPSDLPESVLNTISQVRAASTRRLYVLKWSAFSTWCTTRSADPVVCDISFKWSFLQELF